jgi:hypothetical protein
MPGIVILCPAWRPAHYRWLRSPCLPPVVEAVAAAYFAVVLAAHSLPPSCALRRAELFAVLVAVLVAALVPALVPSLVPGLVA